MTIDYLKKWALLIFICLYSKGVVADWQKLDEGLEFGRFLSPVKATRGDSIIRVLRVNPKRYGFRLLNASAGEDRKPLSAKTWCRQEGLIAAINASMYQKDRLTSVSYMRSEQHINNPWLTKDMAVLAFNPKNDLIPSIKLIDLQCEDFDYYRKQYRSFVQSIRMIACNGDNVWEPYEEAWSMAVIATDHSGNALLIHVTSPFTTHDLINILKELPLDINRAMYAEGGPQAQLYIKAGKQAFEYYGMVNSGLGETTMSTYEWPIPNVIGVYLSAK